MNRVERFWAKVDPGDGDACWLWTAAKSQGRGRFKWGDRIESAHRISYELANGPIPPDVLVRHKCDNPSCVRPDHLELGSQLDNMRDAKERGRTARGEGHGRHLLTVAQVETIRVRYATGAERLADLADEFGVRESAVSLIVRGLKWADAPGPIVTRHAFSGRSVR